MDTQEHKIKKSSSGRESHGVYLCHKCGWPFTKAHPSAKHRRAHKKVCGTIEGYKLVESDDHSAVSDGEHASGEDQRTPSLMVDKRGVKALGSSDGNSLQSNRSVDDLFSDAVAEFSDGGASPAIEDDIKDLNKDMEKLAHIDSVEGQSFSGQPTAGTLDNSIAPKQSIKAFNSEVEEQVITQSENANSSSEARIEESPVASIGVTALKFDGSPVTFETPTDQLIEDIDADAKDEKLSSSVLDNPITPLHGIKISNSEVAEQIISQSENAKSSSETRIEKSSVASIGVTGLQFDASPVLFETPTDELIEGIDADAKDKEINKTLTDCLNPHVEATRELSESYSSIEGTLENLISPIQSIKASNSEINEKVISQPENSNSSSEARIEESHVESIGLTASPFDASPVTFETPSDELTEGIDADVKDEEINETVLNPHVEAARESSEPYLNEIDEQASDNIWEEESTPLAVNEKQSKSEVNENKNLDFVTQDTPAENDTFRLEKHLYTKNSVTEFDGNKSGDQSEIGKGSDVSLFREKEEETTVSNFEEQNEADIAISTLLVPDSLAAIANVAHLREDLYTKNSVTEFDGNKSGDQSEMGKDSDVSLFREKEEETTVSNFEEQTEADIAISTLSVPDSLAAITSVAHLSEDLKDYASQESSLPLDLGSSEVITYDGDDTQSAIAGQRVSGFRLVDSSSGMDGTTIDQNTSKDNLNEKEVGNHITDKSRVSGSTEETTNLVTRDDPDQSKMSKSEESDEGIKQYNKRLMDYELAANDKRILGADSSFLVEDNQITSSLKVHHSQVLKEGVVELSKVCATIEKNTKVGHQSAGDTKVGHESAGAAGLTQKSGDVEVQQKFDSRGNMEQVAASSCKGAYTLSQLGTGNVTDNTFSVASAVKNIERNHNARILTASGNQGALITNEVASLPIGSEHVIHTSNMVDVTHSSLASKEYPGCGSESLQGKGENKLETLYDGVSVSIASSSRADSMDGNWGSVSVASSSADPGVPSEKSQTTSLPVRRDASESHTVMLDAYEPPSFMTLVEPGNAVPQKDTPSDLSALTTQQQKDGDPKAGWFPTISNVVNESQGRKKNEEIIDKVSSWSTGKKHSPLKNLLGEARSPDSKRQSSVTERDEFSSKNGGVEVTTVDAILRSEPNGKEIEKEWNSPARYPVEIKKEKRKRKPYWVPFVCCLSVQRDL